jgi:hypothetical protein
MKNDKQSIATRIAKAKHIQAYHINLNEPIIIDYINSNPEENDDIILTGNNCTIFYEDLDNCLIQGNTLYFKDYYIIHLK